MKLHFDTVFYHVADLDRAIPFYCDVLGLHFLSRDSVARFDLDGVLIELVPAAAAPRHPDGNARLCFRVPDARSARAELRKKGVPVDQLEEKGNGVLVTFRDPDGNELCLWQYR